MTSQESLDNSRALAKGLRIQEVMMPTDLTEPGKFNRVAQVLGDHFLRSDYQIVKQKIRSECRKAFNKLYAHANLFSNFFVETMRAVQILDRFLLRLKSFSEFEGFSGTKNRECLVLAALHLSLIQHNEDVMPVLMKVCGLQRSDWMLMHELRDRILLALDCRLLFPSTAEFSDLYSRLTDDDETSPDATYLETHKYLLFVCQTDGYFPLYQSSHLAAALVFATRLLRNSQANYTDADRKLTGYTRSELQPIVLEIEKALKRQTMKVPDVWGYQQTLAVRVAHISFGQSLDKSGIIPQAVA